MRYDCASPTGKFVFGACLALALGTGVIRAADTDTDLHAVFEKQQKQIEELQERLKVATVPVAVQPASAEQGTHAFIGEDVIKSIASDYIKQKPSSAKGLFGKLASYSVKGS